MRHCLVVVLCIALMGCGGQESVPAPAVVVSVPPQAWIVERLAGNAYDIVILVPPGANPTTHEPTLAQMRAVAHADLYVRVGHPNFAFEQTWFDEVFADAKAPIVNSAEVLESNEFDPHIWTSPRRMKAVAIQVAEHLGNDRLPALLAEIDSLDVEIAAALAPHRGKRFFVFHAAWGYFAQDYGLEQVSIERGHMEPSVADLEAVIREARDSNVKTIFVQPQFSSESAQLVADAVGARLVTVDPLARDWPAGMRAMVSALVQEFER